jgi:hypothetical protein
MLAWYVNVSITQSVSIVFLAGFAFFSVNKNSVSFFARGIFSGATTVIIQHELALCKVILVR